MKLIVGLGNPTEEYEKTRHNVGFIILDSYIDDKIKIDFKKGFSSLYIKDDDVFYQKPLTYMNESGRAIIELVNYFKLDPKKDLLVIYDDMDLEVGTYKLRAKGSSGGHNGIKSIISHIGDEFLRLKIGIGKAKNKGNTISHVLGKFSKEEFETLDVLKKDIFKIIKAFTTSDDNLKFVSKYNMSTKKNTLKFRKAKVEDISRLLEIKEEAMLTQKENNTLQWSLTYPNEDTFKNDINKDYGYVAILDDTIVAYAALCTETDPFYLKFYDGNICFDEDATTIHRVMVSRSYLKQNIASELIKKLISISVRNSIFTIRIDTSDGNIGMKKVINKLKFNYIAKVNVADGSPRNVYEKKI